MKQKTSITDLQECRQKIEALLEEYRCNIEYDNEMASAILVAVDINKFELLPPNGKLT